MESPGSGDATAQPFQVGDHVRWNTSQGQTRGKVAEIRTEDFQLHHQTFRASSDDPRYIVESDKSGERAAHTADALEKA